MRAVVGLGNPGRRHEGTRHNVGFAVVGELCRRTSSSLRAGPGSFWWTEIPLAGRGLIVMCPTMYMNASGRTVLDLTQRMGVAAGEILVVVDDVNLPLGALRLRAGGSDGGHQGLASIIGELATEDFPRLRLGVGKAVQIPGDELGDFVLARFDESERSAVDEMIRRAADAVESILTAGFAATQNAVNRRNGIEPSEGQ